MLKPKGPDQVLLILIGQLIDNYWSKKKLIVVGRMLKPRAQINQFGQEKPINGG